MDVVHALDTSQALKNDLITAATIQGEVTLSGRVSSEASRGLAESIASHVPGVTKVNNNLKVGNPQDAQAAQDESNSQPDEGVPSQPDDQGQFRGQIHGDVQAQIQAQRQAQQQARAYATPNGPVTVPQGTLLQLRTSEPVNSKRAKDGRAGSVHCDSGRGHRQCAGDSARRHCSWSGDRDQAGRRAGGQPRTGADAHLAGHGRAELPARYQPV